MWSGFESPGEWEDHHRIFGVDGPDIQYTVGEISLSPSFYLTHNLELFLDCLSFVAALNFKFL